MRVLVCGDRNWADWLVLAGRLDAFHEKYGISCVIEGEARGADTTARLWAEKRGIPVEKFPAQWQRYDKAAGPIRNQQMLDEGRPEQVIAFHKNIDESRGTKDMVTRAKGRGIPVEVYRD